MYLFIGQEAGVVDYFRWRQALVPRALIELLNDPDPEKSRRVMKAMLQMNKIDVNTLQRASLG